MNNILSILARWTDRLIGLSSIIGTLALIFVVLTILLDVIGRNLLNAPLSGTQDLAQMAMAIIVFGGMAVCDRDGANVSVDIFEHSFPDWMNRALDVIGWCLGAAIFIAIGMTMIESAAISKMLNLSTNILGIPKAPFQYAVAGFSFLTAFSMLLRSVRTLLLPRPQERDSLKGEL